MLLPCRGKPLVVVVDVVEGKATQPGGQGVGLVIVQDARGALKADLATRAGMDFGKAEFQGVVAQLDHGSSLVAWLFFLPIPVPDLAHHAQEGVVGHIFQLADQVGKQPGPGADDGLPVLGDLAGHGQ